jgi:uncharacterized membrane protein YkvA (DUF1232 family)
MTNKEEDFYKKLRNDINSWMKKNTSLDNKWKDFILLAPDMFHLLVKLSLDSRVPISKKAKLTGAIAYFISPLDLLPELFLGPLGYLDDISIAAYVLNDVVNEIDPQIVREHWAGDSDILFHIKNILANANNMLGSGIWRKLRKKI